MTRAAISKAQGGKWSAGFWSGFASSALAPLAQGAGTTEAKVAISAIVGGTASELGGGKFANGAVTGAFVMMYNELGHESRQEIVNRRAIDWSSVNTVDVNISASRVIMFRNNILLNNKVSDFYYINKFIFNRNN